MEQKFSELRESGSMKHEFESIYVFYLLHPVAEVELTQEIAVLNPPSFQNIFQIL